MARVARVILACALLTPVFVTASPSQTAQTAPPEKVVALSLRVEPVDAQRTRFVFRVAEGGFAVFDARSATADYTTRGLVIEMNAGTMTFRGQSTSFTTASWLFDGTYLQMRRLPN